MFYPKKYNTQQDKMFEHNSVLKTEDGVINLEFDEGVKAGKLQIDFVIIKQLQTCAFYSSACVTHQQKIMFINSIRTLNTLTVYYWLIDEDFKARMKRLNDEFLEIQEQCEPGKDSIEDGITPNGEPIIDIAVDFAHKKFLLLMSIITRANKTFETEDVM